MAEKQAQNKQLTFEQDEQYEETHSTWKQNRL